MTTNTERLAQLEALFRNRAGQWFFSDWDGNRIANVLKDALSQHSAEQAPYLPENETEAMHDAVMAVLYEGVTRGRTNALWQAYRGALLAAAPKQAEQQAGPVEASPCPDPDACDAARGCKHGCEHRTVTIMGVDLSRLKTDAQHARLYRFLRDSTPLAMLQFIAVHSDTPEEFDAALTAYMLKHEAAARRLNPAQHPGAPEAPQDELF